MYVTLESARKVGSVTVLLKLKFFQRIPNAAAEAASSNCSKHKSMTENSASHDGQEKCQRLSDQGQ